MNTINDYEPKEFLCFESKMNKPEETKQEKFEIIESSIGFNHNDFRERIIDFINYIGLNKEELAESVYISKQRMKSLLSSSKFSSTEISRIRKRLNF